MSAGDFAFPDEQYVLIGKIVKVHGLQGEVKVYPYSEQPENIKAYKEVVLITGEGEISVPLGIVSCRTNKKFAVIGFDSIRSRDHAEQLVGMGLLLERSKLPPVAENSYYWQDYIGRDVHTNTGDFLGKVEKMFSNGAQDILVITGTGEEYLVPVTRDIIIEEQKEGLVINPPPGLLDINSGEFDR